MHSSNIFRYGSARPMHGAASVRLAHGEAPAALNGLVGVDEEIVAVRTNIGIALMGPENEYTYLCPALWGEEDVFPQIRLNVEGQLTTATNGYVHLWNGCTFDSQALIGWDGQFGGSHDGIILERRAEGTRFWDGRNSQNIVFEYKSGRVDTHLRRDADIILDCLAEEHESLRGLRVGSSRHCFKMDLLAIMYPFDLSTL